MLGAVVSFVLERKNVRKTEYLILIKDSNERKFALFNQTFGLDISVLFINRNLGVMVATQFSF